MPAKGFFEATKPFINPLTVVFGDWQLKCETEHRRIRNSTA
jgi:hypothetical protein